MRAFLVAAFLLANVPSAFAAEDCILLKAATLPLEDYSSGRIVVPVSINGSERKFVLDTGGFMTALRRSSARELGLHWSASDRKVFGLRGEIPVGTTTVDEIGFGVSKGRHITLQIIPDDSLPADVDGVLSPNLLRNFDLDFDFGAHVLNLMSPKHCKGKVVYWTLDFTMVPFSITESGHISIPVTLDGQRLTAVVDTGVGRTILGGGVAYTRFGLSETSAGTELVDTNPKSVLRYRKHFQTLALDGITVNNPEIYVRSRALELAMDETVDPRLRSDAIYGPDFEKIDLLLGMNILSRLHVYIAYNEHMLYVSAANAAPINAANSTPTAAAPAAAPPPQ